MERDERLVLISRAIKGDAEAFESLYPSLRRHLVLRAAERYQGLPVYMDREMCVDEAILKIWQTIGTLREPKAFWGFCDRVLENVARDAYRKKRRTPEIHFEDMARPQGDEDGVEEWEPYDTGLDSAQCASDERAQMQWALIEAIEQLPEDERSVLILSYAEGLSHNEIAERLGITPAAARKRQSRAYKRMYEMDCLKEYRPRKEGVR